MAISKRGAAAAVWLSAALLVSCGGGDGGGAPAGSTVCDVPAQKDWLRSYMLDWYLWSGLSPNPEPAGYATVQDYLDALRYPGDSPVPQVVPRDKWSYIQDTASYNQFFAEGKSMGYGIFVNGIEHLLPLRVRYVEPNGPAALAGLVRGDTIVSINGRSAADVIADDIAAGNGFAMLSPANAGDMLNLVIDSGAGARTVNLTAATYDLTPVSVSNVFTLPSGAKAGYLVLKDFITQAEAPIASVLANFRSQGATELIVDLRYNGGGRISTATQLASQIVGALKGGQTFTTLVYNGNHQSSNYSFVFSSAPADALTFDSVTVLTGSRTCSASELIVNGLRPHFAPDKLVTIGGTTCGKPFGFNPVASCGNTYSVVNFESGNSLGQGRYYGGIAARCPMTDDFSGQLGDPAEKLTAAALSYLQTGVCPPAGAVREQPLSALRRALGRGTEPGDRQGMRGD